jgi:hypothetical protein
MFRLIRLWLFPVAIHLGQFNVEALFHDGRQRNMQQQQKFGHQSGIAHWTDPRAIVKYSWKGETELSANAFEFCEIT